MQLIEAALAFAITMLALSLVVSSFVEIIHRICSMREAGLKYMLGQMFDQVIAKYLSDDKVLALVNRSRPAAQPPIAIAEEAWKTFRDSFVERMSANRAPMGVPPNATPADPAFQVTANPKHSFGLWNGRDLAAMTATEFMERLGSMDAGQAIVEARSAAKDAVQDAGTAAADASQCRAQGHRAEVRGVRQGSRRLFRGPRPVAVGGGGDRAGLCGPCRCGRSVPDLSARPERACQGDRAIPGGDGAAQGRGGRGDGAAACRSESDIDPGGGQEADRNAEERLEGSDRQCEFNGQAIRRSRRAARLERRPHQTREDAGCVGMDLQRPEQDRWDEGIGSLWKDCGKNRWKEVVWFRVPFAPDVVLYLFLGGLLVGLGAPFWYNAVTGLTNIRNAGRGTASADAQTRAGVAVAAQASTIQPATPVDVFRVSQAAQQ